MRISSLFSNGMILQRDVRNVLRGEMNDGEVVSIQMDGIGIPVFSDASTRTWRAKIPAFPAGGPHILSILVNDQKVMDIEDLLFGDVYVLGGQSNMELPVMWTTDYHYDEILSADFPKIRQFEVPKMALFGKKSEMLEGGNWVNCDQEHIGGFSAIGFYFAKAKFLEDGIPVGLIQTAVGGAPVESLMSEENLIACYEKIRAEDNGSGVCNNDKSKCCLWCYKGKLEQNHDEEFVRRTQEEDLKRQDNWHQDLAERDPGLQNNWKDTWEISGKYETFVMPSTFLRTTYEEYKGSVWLQKRIEVPQTWCDKKVELRLGTLIDSDTTYVNGQKVGEFGFKYPPRRYFLEPGILKPGENTITIRLVMDGNIGGAVPDCPYCLKNGEEEISLSGEWAMRKGAESERLEGPTFFIWAPTALYNSMINPLRDVSCKAILFYQGESNCEYPQHYAALLKDMVKEWRSLLGEDVPFYMAEVTYWLGDGPVYENDPFDGVRKVQREVVTDIPHAYLIPTYDLGMYNDLHPQNKKEVAMRFFEKYKETETSNH